MTTKKHRTPRAGLTQGGPTGAVTAGCGNRGPPRAGETGPALLGRDHDRALRGQAGRSSQRLTLHVEGFLLGHLNYVLLSSLLFSRVPSWFGEAVAPRGQRWRLAWDISGRDVGFLFPCNQKSGEGVLCGQNLQLQNQNYFKLGRGLFYKVCQTLLMCLSFSRQGQKGILPN